MNTDRWLRIKEIFTAALKRAPDIRAAFIKEACADDPDLRREVEDLIRSPMADVVYTLVQKNGRFPMLVIQVLLKNTQLQQMGKKPLQTR